MPRLRLHQLPSETDVMDTRATSSLTTQINIRWARPISGEIGIPMSLRPQAHDIIRNLGPSTP